MIPFKEWPPFFRAASLVLGVCLFFSIFLSSFLSLLRHGLPIQLPLFMAIFFILVPMFRSWFAKVPQFGFLVPVLATIFAGLWIEYPTILIRNLTAFLLVLAIFPRMKGIKFSEAIVIGLGVILYDVIMVFGTGMMMEMADTFKGVETPLVFAVTPSLAPFIGISMIGLGDIVLPGVMIVSAIELGKKFGTRFIPVAAFIGYAVALAAAIVLAGTFGAQPATLYLFPGVFLGIWSALLMKKIPLSKAMK